MGNRLPRHSARPAEPELRAALSRLIDRHGSSHKAADDLDVHERTLVRAAAGAPVRVATIELLANRLLELDGCSRARECRLRLVRDDIDTEIAPPHPEPIGPEHP